MYGSKGTDLLLQLYWKPGHIGIKENEKAVEIAKEAIDHPIYYVKLPFSDLKPRIYRYVNSIFQDKWNNCCTNKLHEFSLTKELYSNNRKHDVKLN